jgi:uncharacterized membrane protein YfcA
MSAGPAIFIIVMAFITAAVSGVFGMAGGLMLKGALALVLPVSATFVAHGILQFVANGWRALLHRRHVDWRVVGLYGLGAMVAAAVTAMVALQPTRATLFLLMGLTPLLVWVPERWIRMDATRPVQAFICGLSVTAVNLTAGVAGGFLDIFFVRTALTRHQIVATKAATQVFSHLMKIVVYGVPLLAVHGQGMPPAWVFAIAIPVSMLGTAAGGLALNRLSDVNFKRYLRTILTVIGALYLAQAARLFLTGA